MSPCRAIVGILVLAIFLQGFPLALLSRLAGPEPSSCEAIVVLGYAIEWNTGLVPEGGLLSQRLALALKALASGNTRTLVLSGGIAEDVVSQVSEAAAMKRWLEERSVLRAEVLLEEVSVSTRTNALYSLERLLEAKEGALPNSICLATNSFHRFRARRIFERALRMKADAAAVQIFALQDATPKTVWSAFFGSNVEVEEAVQARRELLAIAYYFIRGWL
ncbi:yfiI [Symbiodinium natans]|uniref:YfiI protein n=1 Tax=Symbiodinium natans TaxID=878477 RepID=A0A812KXT0_9DINO|nr:yfiI [Symbiodinium natans]